jgi:hypothetical protein
MKQGCNYQRKTVELAKKKVKKRKTAKETVQAQGEWILDHPNASEALDRSRSI